MGNSKSAQNKLVVLADLPNSTVPSIGEIPSHYLFPIIGVLKRTPSFNLHSDGSIFQIFELPEFSMQVIDMVVENMADDSSIQLYRIHKENGSERYFFCLRLDIDYDFIDLRGRKFFHNLFSSYAVYTNELEQITESRYEAAMRAVPANATEMPINNNPDYATDEGFAHSQYQVKSNISAILCGKSKHSCVFSVNNLDAVPLNFGILQGHDFLEVVTLVKPSRRQKDAIETSINVNREILSAIRPSNMEARAVEVDTMKADYRHIIKEIQAGVFFIDVSFCLPSVTSLQDLREKFGNFEDVMYQKGVVLYCHSNSARAQYISMFPGNSIYGEHWNKVYKQFGLMLISKVMGL
jgi:hypothetical protein